MTPLLSYQALPNVGKIAKAIQDAYNNSKKVKQLGKASREFALQYDYDKYISVEWDNILQGIIDNADSTSMMKPNVSLGKKKSLEGGENKKSLYEIKKG